MVDEQRKYTIILADVQLGGALGHAAKHRTLEWAVSVHLVNALVTKLT
jgi:hypothetical protein